MRSAPYRTTGESPAVPGHMTGPPRIPGGRPVIVDRVTPYPNTTRHRRIPTKQRRANRSSGSLMMAASANRPALRSQPRSHRPRQQPTGATWRASDSLPSSCTPAAVHHKQHQITHRRDGFRSVRLHSNNTVTTTPTNGSRQTATARRRVSIENRANNNATIGIFTNPQTGVSSIA